MFLTFDNESKIGFKKRKENYFFYFLSSNKKNFAYKMCLAITSKSKTDFQNRKWDYQNRKWNYFSYFLSSNKKNLLQNVYN